MINPSVRRVALAVLLPLVPLAGGCGSGKAGAPPPAEVRSDKVRVTSPVVASDDLAQLAADNRAFAVDLHQRLRAGEVGNFVFSPASVSIALAMLYGGAAGATASQMAAALHFTLPPERLHPAFDALDLALEAQPASGDAGAFRLSIANSTWAQLGFTFLPAYLDLLAENYGSGMFIQDFARAPEPARAAINGWVDGETEHQIPELFGPGAITPDTRLVLANAVFFHGDWITPFDPNSQNGVFHAPSGDVSVPIMSAKSNGAIWSGTGFRAAALSYVGGTASMVLVVPDAGTFDAFEQGLTADALGAILATGQGQVGMVNMPRFQFSTDVALGDQLQALGMQDAFMPGAADFSGMDGARDLYVQAAVHKAVIAVDEKGTTAAAATGVSVGTASAELNILFVDRPFLFFIRHDATGAILFEGRVLDPQM